MGSRIAGWSLEETHCHKPLEFDSRLLLRAHAAQSNEENCWGDLPVEGIIRRPSERLWRWFSEDLDGKGHSLPVG
jgi:hypothetical protein